MCFVLLQYIAKVIDVGFVAKFKVAQTIVKKSFVIRVSREGIVSFMEKLCPYNN